MSVSAHAGRHGADGAAAFRRKLRRAVEALHLSGASILVACSGGPDSMALLVGLAGLRRELDLTLHAATIDHGLRPGSARDALYVERVARALGLGCARRRLELGRDFPDGVEAAARRARYEALGEVARARGCDAIATGHTLEDQAETVLMRLAAGTGLAGARGIHAVRGAIVRPMLEISREEVRAFLAAQRVRARLDPTNASDAFTRNRVRHHLLPALEAALGPAALRSIARFAQVADIDERCLDALAREAGEAMFSSLGTEGGVTCPVAPLARLAAALRFRVLKRAAAALGSALDFEGFQRVERALGDNGAPRRVALPNGVEARVRYGRFELGRARVDVEAGGEAPVPPLVLDLAAPATASWNGFIVRVRPLLPGEEVRSGGVALALDRGGLGDGLTLPLQVRARQPGYRFAPRGAGHKKLKAWLIDAQVPRERRDDLALLTDSAGEVLWVVGLCESRWTSRRAGPGGGVEVAFERGGARPGDPRVLD